VRFFIIRILLFSTNSFCFLVLLYQDTLGTKIYHVRLPALMNFFIY